VERKVRVLFVDDEEKFLKGMGTRLSLRGFEVLAFVSGAEALAHAEAEPFDVALLDLKMPGMDGEDVLKKLRERDPAAEVIILTGHGSIPSAVQCTRAGACDYLQKPCDFDELIATLSKAYARRVASRHVAQASRVEELMNQAAGLGPLELIQALKRIDDEP
jgi:DNA-binding NtrC family response regulator